MQIMLFRRVSRQSYVGEPNTICGHAKLAETDKIDKRGRSLFGGNWPLQRKPDGSKNAFEKTAECGRPTAEQPSQHIGVPHQPMMSIIIKHAQQ